MMVACLYDGNNNALFLYYLPYPRSYVRMHLYKMINTLLSVSLYMNLRK